MLAHFSSIKQAQMPPKPRKPGLIMGMRGTMLDVKNSGVKVSSDATPLANFVPPGIRGGWSLSRGGGWNERTWTAGKNPKPTSGKWDFDGVCFGFTWIFYDFLLLVQVQTTGLFRWWKNIFPNVEMVFTHRLEFETFSFRDANPLLPQSPEFPPGKLKRFDEAPGICWPGDSGLGQPSWCFFSKCFVNEFSKHDCFEESLRSIFYDGNRMGAI